VQDYNTAIAQRQGEQINRLAVVSMIFLPISFLKGYLGMNAWLKRREVL
jgi:Mg2+ and Co2+ transporter CorA